MSLSFTSLSSQEEYSEETMDELVRKFELAEDGPINFTKNLHKMFSAPEGLTEKKQDRVQQYAEEILGGINSVVNNNRKELQDFLKENVATERLNSKTLPEFVKQTEDAIDSLRFLDSIFENSHNETLYVNAMNYVDGGLIISLHKEDWSDWQIGSKRINRVEISIKTSSEQKSQDYTMLQLGFNLYNINEEVTSLRADIHPIRRQQIQPEIVSDQQNYQVQLDIEHDTNESFVHNKHIELKSINQGQIISNFRMIQQVFLINFVENYLNKSSTKLIMNREIRELIEKEYSKEKNLLGLNSKSGDYQAKPPNQHLVERLADDENIINTNFQVGEYIAKLLKKRLPSKFDDNQSREEKQMAQETFDNLKPNDVVTIWFLNLRNEPITKNNKHKIEKEYGVNSDKGQTLQESKDLYDYTLGMNISLEDMIKQIHQQATEQTEYNTLLELISEIENDDIKEEDKSEYIRQIIALYYAKIYFDDAIKSIEEESNKATVYIPKKR